MLLKKWVQPPATLSCWLSVGVVLYLHMHSWVLLTVIDSFELFFKQNWKMTTDGGGRVEVTECVELKEQKSILTSFDYWIILVYSKQNTHGCALLK
jgi:hypothetical protein